MDVYFLRHAKTKPTETEPVLSEKGRRQLDAITEQMHQREMRPSVILTSPRLRARQSADYVADAIGYGEVSEEGWIAENLPAEQWLRELAVYQEFESIMVVGHEPDLSRVVEWLMGVQFGAVKMKKATLLWLQGITPPSRGATLRLLLPPNL